MKLPPNRCPLKLREEDKLAHVYFNILCPFSGRAPDLSKTSDDETCVSLICALSGLEARILQREPRVLKEGGGKSGARPLGWGSVSKSLREAGSAHPRTRIPWCPTGVKMESEVEWALLGHESYFARYKIWERSQIHSSSDLKTYVIPKGAMDRAVIAT